MQSTKTEDIKFEFVTRGSEAGVEIFFGQGEIFWSCRKGSDLFDFDILLKHFLPDINFEVITQQIARFWEQELYNLFIQCKQQRTAKKAFLNFCQAINSKYHQKSDVSVFNKYLINDFLLMLNKNVTKKRDFIYIDLELSWKKSQTFALAKVLA